MSFSKGVVTKITCFISIYRWDWLKNYRHKGE
jgi:hypothetical protein